MNSIPDQIELYKQRIKNLSIVAKEIKCSKRLLYWSRIVLFLTTILFIILYVKYQQISFTYCIVLSFATFLRVVIVDGKKSKSLQFIEQKIICNQSEISILNHEFNQFDSGNEYIKLNPYLASDFELFGIGSFYQYINRSVTWGGKLEFAKSLVKAELDVAIIEHRQKCIGELSDRIEYRQSFQTYGSFITETGTELDKLLGWLERKALNSSRIKTIILAVWLVNALTIIGIATDLVPFATIGVSLGIGLIFVYSQKSAVEIAHDHLGRSAKIFKQYFPLFELTEKEVFRTSQLVDLQQSLICDGRSASVAIKQLFRILNNFDLRYNIMISVLINALLGFDLIVLLILESWKQKYRHSIQTWFVALSKIDSSISYATLTFNADSSWSMPVPVDGVFQYSATDMGHPLIPQKNRVSNSFTMSGNPSGCVITGANMAGKSTFLRTVSGNLILAMNGAPVCASHMQFSPVEILSSIKIQDSLFKNESYFYAELLRLKQILTYIDHQPKSIVILDEIMRGTNSKDKQVGTKGIIEKLIAKGTSLIIATHDLSIGELASKYPSVISNYCFEVELADDELIFDYKLKSGVSSKLNASFLMKKMNIID